MFAERKQSSVGRPRHREIVTTVIDDRFLNRSDENDRWKNARYYHVA